MTVRQKYAWGGKKKEDELTKGVSFQSISCNIYRHLVKNNFLGVNGFTQSTL